MALSKDNYQLLLEKLDAFIRKFYVNKLLRGVLYSLGSILLLYLAVSLLEYYFHFSSGGRKLLFFGFILSGLTALGWWVVRPAMGYFHLGKVIDHDQAASIIGTHFTNVEDKLLNILQLKRAANTQEATDLIHASIDQKAAQLKPVPFVNAIDLKGNKRYVKYAAIPLGALLLLAFTAPNILKESNERLINNSKDYVQPAPFQFQVKTDELEVMQYEDFLLTVDVTGEALPKEMSIQFEDYNANLKKVSPSRFEYHFKKVQKDLDFQLSASGFSSADYHLKVIPKPMILGFEVNLDYPAYTGRKDEMISNIGDLSVPVGTEVTWKFKTQHTEALEIRSSDMNESITPKRLTRDDHIWSKRLMGDLRYSLYLSESSLNYKDSISYGISVSPDAYPEIEVEKFSDTTNDKFLHFIGRASDDYLLKKVDFVYKIQKEGKQNTDIQGFIIDPGKKARTEFYHSFDITPLGLKPGDKLTYYFEAWDNDGVHGSKSTRTPTMTYEMPSIKEFKEIEKKNNKEIKEELDKSLKEVKEINEEIKELQDKLMQKKELGWEDRKQIEKLLNKNQNLQNQVEDLNNKFKENLKNQEEFKEVDPDIMQKQKQLEEMFEELMNPEMKELFEKLEELLEELNKEQGLEELEEMEMTNEELEQELDRMMELFKQLEFEQQLTETIEELEQLAEEQEELAEQTENKEISAEEAAEQQEELNERFDELMEEMEELSEKSEELGNQDPDQATNEEQENIQQEQQEAQENLQKGKQNKGAKNQQNAAEQMKKMSEKLSAMQQDMAMQGAQENMESLRQLLENLVKLSFDQEELMKEISGVDTRTPKYKDLIQQQHKLKEDAAMVEDSLMALAKRVFQISSFITQEMGEVNRYLNQSIEDLEQRRAGQGMMNQQYVMTGLNNLALMLDEVQQQMQQAMAQQMDGKQNCNKPGTGKPKQGNKPGMSELPALQEQLNKQIAELQKQLKEGKKPGQKQNPMSQQMAEMAKQQAAIREALREMAEQMEEEGLKEEAKDLGEIQEQMEKTEEDIVNKQLNYEMIKRQQEILTRLLEAEEAERQRELDNKRKSETAENINKTRPPEIEEYLKKRAAEVDQYKAVPPSLKPYYRKLVEDYFKYTNSP